MPNDSTALRLLPQLRRVVLARDSATGDGQLLASFVASRDESAFATLVRRHGPMVLGVCRRVVGDPHLAEDAFQATFLVLARRAAAVRPRSLVGHWLYGVAYRTALKARAAAARRSAKEKQVDAMPHPPVSVDQAWADLQPVLDSELARLPDKFRMPIILCDLNGRPQRDVARELKLPPATLANRLSAARRLLAKRLSARGVTLSAGAVASALGWHAATSAVPPALASATVKAACAAAAGTANGLPVPVVQLSEGVMRMFVLSKLKAVAAGAATGLLLLAGLGLLAGAPLLAKPDEQPGKSPAPAATTNPAKPADPHRPIDVDDLTFLRQRSLDLRGTLPTPLEARYFLADKDKRKRIKVTEWMLEEHEHQKVTTNCASCHHPAPGHEFNSFFRGVHSHANLPPETYAQHAEWFAKQPPAKADPEALKAQATVARFRADVVEVEGTVAVAESELKRARYLADLRGGETGLAAAQSRLAKAKADLAGAQDQLQQAEAQLAEAQQKSRFAAWTRHALTESKEPQNPSTELLRVYWRALREKDGSTDLEFLRRVSQDVRGVAPTKVEENYFLADKDAKKREKLLELLAGKTKGLTAAEKLMDELLADPEVQKRWAAKWKERLAAERQVANDRAVVEAWWNKPADRLARLMGDLLDSKRADEQVLDALCLATMARFPTETEKKLILEALKGQPDRRAAWNLVLAALASTQEAKAHAEGLTTRGAK